MMDRRMPLVFVGTYSEPILFGQVLHGQGKGIHAFRLDAQSGALLESDVTENIRNPSYIAFDPARRFLYCVNEFKEFQGAPSGAVSAFRIDHDTGALTFLNFRASGGTDPCHLIVDATGKSVLIANFASGSVCVLPIKPDGSLGEATDFVQHEGSSIDPRRQAGPHAHAVEIDAADRYVFVPDLGLDRVVIYAFDATAGTLAPNPHQPWIATAPGAGPRQLVFHPNGRFAYLINELNSTMTAYGYDESTGSLAEINTLSTLPSGFDGQSTCAEIQISPSGRFLYGSNRGHDSIVIYSVRRRALSASQGKMGKLTIGLITAALYGPLPDILADFRRQFPDISLNFVDNISPSEALLRTLDEGLTDLVFVHPPVRLTGEFDRATIVHEPLVAALPEDHRLAKRERIDLIELADDPWIMFPREINDKGIYDRLITLCHRAGFSPRVTQEASQTLTRLALVAAGFGVHLVHRAWERIPFPGVVYIAVEPSDHIVVAGYWRRTDQSPLLGHLVGVIRQHVG